MCRQWASQDRVQTDTWGPPPVQTGAKHSTQVTPQAMNSNDIRLDLFCQIMFYLCFLAHIFCIPLIGFHKITGKYSNSTCLFFFSIGWFKREKTPTSVVCLLLVIPVLDRFNHDPSSRSLKWWFHPRDLLFFERANTPICSMYGILTRNLRLNWSKWSIWVLQTLLNFTLARRLNCT